MEEIENQPIKITLDDIEEANKLSEGCPMCGNPVYRQFSERALMPVECVNCDAIYHKVCWEELGGGVCAMVGCEERKYRPYGQETDVRSPAVRIDNIDLGRVSSNQQLKYQERQVRREVSGGVVYRFFAWVWDQLVNDSRS